ncbi:hypothetical protein DKM44_05135 [Deinococcus irradiatisoli]|uniref:Uncharacterized protein n=1 Tax=Deinococcus irradiatisoli TaxID=2202254 RepID=A0A2Z3JC16_9DEIO|nr:hypothetical protein [Deinococcus irradiatisoli]AWN22693.1 hypothetical protein DKM44_05135 [Deinococcus irradiatisoli]
MNARRGCGCGCGGLVVLLLALAAAAYFLVYRPVTVFLNGWRAPAQTSSTAVPAAGGNVNAPLARSDVQKFVRIRRDERAALGSSFASVENTFQRLQDGQTPGLWQVTGVLRDLGNSVGQARAAQTAGLAREQLSRERFNVIAGDVNRALGVPDIDFGKIASDVQRGRVPDFDTAVRTQASPQTKALIEPFKSELTATAALGLLGL